jgi:ABC-type phosphate transport system substrate-binding protein
MKTALAALVLAAASFSAQAGGLAPQPSFNDNAPITETVNEARTSVAIDGSSLPQPSFKDYVDVKPAANSSPVATDSNTKVAGLPVPSFSY